MSDSVTYNSELDVLSNSYRWYYPSLALAQNTFCHTSVSLLGKACQCILIYAGGFKGAELTVELEATTPTASLIEHSSDNVLLKG